MDFSVLGPLRVSTGDGAIQVRAAKERALLAHLVAYAGRVVPASELIATLWGSSPPRSAAKSLQTYVLRLRNTLEPDRAGAATLIVTDGPGYRLAIQPEAVDAAVFSRLAELGERALAEGRPEDAVAAFGEGLALWRGPAYVGFEEVPFARAEARRLEELRLTAAESMLRARVELGQEPAVVAEVERLLGDNPFRERLWELLLLALYRSDRQGEALAAYERARRVLADDLGVDPGPQLQALHARILAQDPGLARRVRRPAVPPSLRPPPTPMVGRTAELERLRDAWRRTVSGAPVTVVLRGPRGAGATRLVSALAVEVAGEGHPVALHETLGVDSPDCAALVVADRVPPARVMAERPPRAMVLAVADPGAAVPEGAEVIDLAPLDAESVRRLVSEYVAPADVEALTAELLDGLGPAWPARVHEVAAESARSAAARRVAVAAAATNSSSAQLLSARADLSDGIVALDRSQPRAPVHAPEVCPWRGLAAYDVADAPWFAGRERLVAELVARLAATRLLAVVGASGSGKSSAIRAGLVASLEANVLPGSSAWRIVLMRPGTHPMRELAHAAMARESPDLGDVLASLIDANGGSSRTVLVVDQAEEVWAACEDESERHAFLETLTELVTDPVSEVSVVLALRADYLGELADHPELAAALADATVLVGAPTEAEVRRAVERPAARANLRLEDGLADTIVADAGREPGLLPLLSTTMTRLWERSSDGVLGYAAYVGMGGLPGAIAHTAEETWDSLDGDQQRAARLLLLRLAGPGDGTAVSRRRVPLAEVEALPTAGPVEIVNRLSESRLLTVSDGYVEVAHEALFREWPRLRGWLADDVAGRAVQRRLALAASEWDNEGRDSALLWRGARLLSAVEVAESRPDEVTAIERAFLEAGQAAEHAAEVAVRERAEATARQNRRLRRLLMGLGALLALALVAGALTLQARGQAQRSAERAEEAAVTADARALAADALNQDYLDVGLLQAVEATRLEPGPESYGALLTLLARTPDVISRFRIFDRFLRIGASPDGTTVYLSDNTNQLRALDAVSGDLRWQVTSPGGAAQWGQVAASPDGEWLAVSLLEDTVPDSGRVLAILEADDGELRHEVTVGALREMDPSEPGGVGEAVGVLADGSVAVPTSANVFVVDAEDGTVRRRVAWDEDQSPYGFVMPDGRVAAQVGETHTALLDVTPDSSDPDSRRLPGSIVGWSEDDRLVATTTVRQTGDGEVSRVRIRDLDDWSPTGDEVDVDGFVREVDWVSGGLLVATDEQLELYDGRTLELERTFPGHNGALLGFAAVGPQRDIVWTAGRDGSAIAHDLSGTRGTVRSQGLDGPLWVGDADASGRIAVHTPMSTTAPNPVRMLDVATGDDLFGELEHRPDCFCQVGAVDMADDGGLAVGIIDEIDTRDFTFGSPNHLAIWDTGDGSLRRLVRLPWRATGVALSPDAGRVVLNGVHEYGVLDLASGDLVWGTEHPVATDWFESMPQAGFSPDGETVVLLRGGTALLADALSGRELAETTLPEARNLLRAAWGPGATTIVVGSMTGRVYFLDAETLEAVAPQRLLTGGFVIDLEVDPDGKMLAAMGSDGDVTLFDTATWRPYGKPVTDGLAWGFLAFVGDSLRIFSELGTVTTLDTDPSGWVERACAVANRDLSDEESAMIRPGAPNTPICG